MIGAYYGPEETAADAYANAEARERKRAQKAAAIAAAKAAESMARSLRAYVREKGAYDTKILSKRVRYDLTLAIHALHRALPDFF